MPTVEKQKLVDVATTLLERNAQMEEKHEFEWNDLKFVVHPHVFSPSVFADTKFYLNNITIPAGASFLEIGCGAGLMAVGAALNGASPVMAADISPHAVANTLENAELHNVDVQAFVGSVYEPLPEGAKFDYIFWNLPSIITEKLEFNWIEQTIYDPGYKGLEDYIRYGRDYLTPDGKLLLGFSSTGGDFNALSGLAAKYNWRLEQQIKKVFYKFDNFSIEIYRFVDLGA